MTTIIPIDDDDPIKEIANPIIKQDESIVDSQPASNHMNRSTTITEARENKQYIPYILSCGNPAFYWGTNTCVAHLWCCGYEKQYKSCGCCCMTCFTMCGPCCLCEYAHYVRGYFNVDYCDFYHKKRTLFNKNYLNNEYII